jgi:AraC-like DNA-binding protein
MSRKHKNSMQNVQTATSEMPLVRLRLINPFIAELQRRNVDSIPLLERVGLPREMPIADEVFVPAGSVYDFLEMAAEAAGDRYLGATVGRDVDLELWPPFAESMDASTSVNELLSHFVVNANHHATSVKMALQTEGVRSKFYFQRALNPSTPPSQNDAFYIGLLVTLFRRALGDRWQAKQVLAEVCEPGAIPANLGPLTLVQGDNRGVNFGFPSEWLFEPFSKRSFVREYPAGQEFAKPPVTLIDSLREALLPHIHESDLTVERGAAICGYEKRKLSRILKNKGTTLVGEIARLREERAVKELEESARKIADIALSVGFKDPTVFSRAFKNWTGQSPQEYRRNSRNSQGREH